jgi:hypothetical protein
VTRFVDLAQVGLDVGGDLGPCNAAASIALAPSRTISSSNDPPGALL